MTGPQAPGEARFPTFPPELLEKVHNLPLQPGVYIMKNKDGDIIYIGKAKALKNRVSQYFQNSRNHGIKVLRMIQNIHDFHYIVTDTEFEALVLECNLIKMHKPKYNILLKDDKAYPFLRVDVQNEYPRLTLARKKAKDGAKYYGPYKNGKVIRDTIDLLQKLFRIPTCNRQFPRDIGKGRPCLNYHIKRCIAPCMGQVTPEEYRSLLGDVIDFIEGDTKEILRQLQQRMEEAAEALEFEKAAQLRDRIRSIQQLGDRQKVYSARESDVDILATYENGGKVCLTVLFIRYGKLLDKDCFFFSSEDFAEEGALAQFIRQFYHEDSYVPREILVEQELEDARLLEQMLHPIRGGAVTVRCPKRGEMAGLMEMARANSKQELESILTREERVNKTLSDLQKLLQLPALPRRIESYDISNMGDRDIVAGMVVYQNGAPAKREYRRFKVRSTDGQDDYAAMKEVLYRRFAEREEGNEKFATLPDLILLDGGQGHLNAVLDMFRELDIQVPVAGMVKDDRHRTRELVTRDGFVAIAGQPHLYAFIGSIQEEVHRFSIAYHRDKRSKSSMSSALAGIPGVGPARQKKLLKAFRGLKGLRAATQEQLAQVEGIPQNVAEAVYRHFHPVQNEEEQL
ncbi:MAG: excinuclease ABC subunit UvrC [Eubacteriales bacterium]|jgi:excinuclease ABC subunit C